MTRFRALPRVLALLASLLGGCAYLPWGSSDSWQTVTTKRFTAFSHTALGHTGTLEALEQGHALLQGSFFGTKPIAPVEVLLVDWPELRQLIGERRTHLVVARLPAKGVLGRRGVMLMYGRDGSVAGAAHRLTHLFIHAIAPKAPLWLHEGMATYLERAEYRDTERDVVACLGHLPPKAPDVPIDELMKLTFQTFDDSDKASTYRLAATNLIDYFVMGEGGKLKESLVTYIEAVGDGADQVAAMAKVFGGLTPAQLQEKAREHRRVSETRSRGVCPLSYPLGSDRVADTGKPTIKPIAMADLDRLRTQLRMLPRRNGQIDWYPADAIGVDGGQFPLAPAPADESATTPPAPAATPAAAPTSATPAAPAGPGPATMNALVPPPVLQVPTTTPATPAPSRTPASSPKPARTPGTPAAPKARH